MSYNNHHAGLHMIRYNRFSSYDDLNYYDNLAIEDFKRKKKEKQMKHNEEKQEINTLLYEDKKMVKSEMKFEENNKLENQNKNRENKNKENKNKNIFGIEYGKKHVINNKHFLLQDAIMFNIFRIAIQRKQDIKSIIDECELIAQEDIKMNPNPNKLLFTGTTKMDNAFIYLSMLVEKMNCDISELFICNDEMRKQFVYDLINQIPIDDWSDDDREYDIDDPEDLSRVIRIDNFDYYYKMSTTKIDYHDIIFQNGNFKNNMALKIRREYYDSKFYYTLEIGHNTFYPDNRENYMRKFCFLWEEDDGNLKEYSEMIFKKLGI